MGTDVPHIMVMDTASGAIMGVMLATMVAMQAMAMVAITVLDTDTMVELDAAMGTVPLCLALLENRKIRNIYIFFREIKKKKKKNITFFFWKKKKKKKKKKK